MFEENVPTIIDNINLCEQICECVIQFDDAMEEKNIDFEADLEEHAIIAADKDLMEMVWNNLLSNAVKFTSANGRIIIRQKTGACGITVSVSDTGCGMNADTQKKIFEKFYQGDTSHATEGNGLGLALVFRILSLLNCHIAVKSELGKGSVFTVRIPMKLLAERS